MEQLTTDGGAEELVAPVPKPGIRYKRFPESASTVAITMATPGQRRTAVLDLFPEYAASWNEDESILWNWINAHAVTYFDGKYRMARQMVNDASDHIYGGKNAAAIAKFIWYLA